MLRLCNVSGRKLPSCPTTVCVKPDIRDICTTFVNYEHAFNLKLGDAIVDELYKVNYYFSKHFGSNRSRLKVESIPFEKRFVI